jgi:tetratricopeptide (TPR) repeat protein
MTPDPRVGSITVTCLALWLAGVHAQGTTVDKKPAEPKSMQATIADLQAKPAGATGEAAQEEMPADFTAFNDAGKEKDALKRVEAYEKFIAAHPDSGLVATARNQIHALLLASLKTAQTKYLDVMQQQIEIARKDPSARTLPSTYSRLASGLLSAGVMLEQAEEYGRNALSSMDEQNYIQERKDAEKRATEKPPARPSSPGFSITMIDGVPVAKPAVPRASQTATRPSTPPRTPTDDELRAGFRAERTSVQATLGQILVKRGKTAEGEAMLKEALAARPAAATMAIIARVLAESAKKTGNDDARLEYLSALALSGRITKDEQQDLEALYRWSHNGSTNGLEAMLDAMFLRTAAKVDVEPSTRTAKPTDRAVLAEMFTGAG